MSNCKTCNNWGCEVVGVVKVGNWACCPSSYHSAVLFDGKVIEPVGFPATSQPFEASDSDLEGVKDESLEGHEQRGPLYGHGSKSRVPPSEHPDPHENRLKWVVHLPEIGTIGFDTQACICFETGAMCCEAFQFSLSF